MIIKQVTTEGDLHAFKTLLAEANLVTDDIAVEKQLLLGAFDGEILMGTGALEICGTNALLRSLCVRGLVRNKSIGSELVHRLIAEAKRTKLKHLYLLTETAHDYFLKKGFVDVDRLTLPSEIQGTYQFKTACPASARAMALTINQ
jgi:amino-acid N-acetyltransferase